MVSFTSCLFPSPDSLRFELEVPADAASSGRALPLVVFCVQVWSERVRSACGALDAPPGMLMFITLVLKFDTLQRLAHLNR